MVLLGVFKASLQHGVQKDLIHLTQVELRHIILLLEF
jgi:hypothetical protein